MDTRMTKRRNFLDTFKATVALEALRGDKTEQEIAAKRQLHPTQVSTWKRQAIEGMAGLGIVRLNSLVGLLPPGALYLRHNFLVCLVIAKHRDTKTAEIPRCYPRRSV
jgi:hypothetical protein